jgi:hypothetical protein
VTLTIWQGRRRLRQKQLLQWEEGDEYETWLEEAELANRFNFDEIPSFNEAFAKFTKETIKTNDEFMEMLRVKGGHISSYENFVATLGNTPGYVFTVFGITFVAKHRMDFIHAWMLASFLRKKPLINVTEDIFDLAGFEKAEWAKYYGVERSGMQVTFITDFGLRTGHDGNVRKQYSNDVKASPISKEKP